MLRKGLGLLVVLGLASLGLAQTTDNHNVTVTIPSILTLSLDATDFIFDFSDTTATGTVTVGGTPYDRAGLASYDNFLDNASSAQDFAPTSVAGTGGNDYGTLIVRSNRATWYVKLSVSGPLPAPLDNGRVKVYAEKVLGKGGSWTSVPTPVTGVTTLISSSTGGQGKSVYKVYYLLTLDPGDDITGTYSHQITVNYTLTPNP
ncbi:hypothetical protein [Thermus filiformis]|uniref:Uncharacterized protein n=1 Tax=Thermus filiformis TaxID=276 RepID=A0A0A2WWA7_THEFI|nr:hypothetical protein [Thermus filiformis]KGQ23067.2 hypothetical protein THFILI_00635 [Thermus filiformis]